MRDIEFRGKRKDNGEWVYGYYVEIFDVDKNKKSYRIYTKFAKKDCDEWYLEFFEVDPETGGQYTGLEDKNRFKIYEGDILKYDGGGIFIVTFDEMMIMCPKDKMEMFSPGYYGILLNDKNKELCPLGPTQVICKVIGNIYDNPELLESGNYADNDTILPATE